jgi:tetratricopeptide (TPR) repeat protein
MAAGDPEAARELAERSASAYDSAGMPVERGIALAYHAQALILVGEGATIADQLIPVYESLESVPGAATAQTHLARLIARCMFAARGDARGSLVWSERAVELAEAEENWELLAASMATYGAALLTIGRPMMGLGMLRTALDVARTNDLPNAQLTPLNNLASFLAARDVAAAKSYVDEGLALARRLGDQATGTYLSNTGMLVCWLSGDWDQAMTLFAESTEGSAVYVMALPYATAIAHDRGIAPPDHMPSDTDSEAPQVRAPVEVVRARQLMRDGDPQGALHLAQEALRLYHEFGGLDDDFPIFWTFAFERAMDGPDVEAAQRLLRLVADAPRGKISPLLRALVPYFRARVVAAGFGDAALVDADYDAAAVELRVFGTPYWLARCLLDRAEWLAGQGRTDETSQLLDEATALFTALDAAPWVARSERARVLALR